MFTANRMSVRFMDERACAKTDEEERQAEDGGDGFHIGRKKATTLLSRASSSVRMTPAIIAVAMP